VTFPLFDVIPSCERRVSRVALGDFPTPVEPLDTVARELGASDGQTWVKRDDISAAAYGGNKVRTLELLFGEARALGREHVVSSGAFGSNHALATAIHAPRVGLRPGALLYPHLGDAVRMVQDGYATAAAIDAAMTLGCGYPRGPLRMLDDIGAARVLAGLRAMHARYGDPAFAPAPLLAEHVAAGIAFCP